MDHLPESIRTAERWGVFELHLSLETAGDEVKVVFVNGERKLEVYPFSLNGGQACIRFMPEEEGNWSFETVGGITPEGKRCGTLLCVPPQPGNRGPLRAAGGNRFAYADGTPFIPFGTTCLYGLEDGRAVETLESLKGSPFNKVRHKVSARTDLMRLERHIAQLGEVGIETELLLDSGDDNGEEVAFLKRVVDRLSAYRNVWWALIADQGGDGESGGPVKERLVRQIRLIRRRDPYRRLLTFLSANPLADYGDAEVTHVSLRTEDASQTSYYAEMHGKPVLLDECGCEGDAPNLWGSLPAEEMTDRLWGAVCRGGYAGHGESFVRPDGSCWRRQGGGLSGVAPARIAFLRAIMEEAPAGLTHIPFYYDAPTIGAEGGYYLQYHGIHRFAGKLLKVPAGKYRVELIDAWNMTVTMLEEAEGTEIFVHLPEPVRTHRALRIIRLDAQAEPLSGDDAGGRSAADPGRFEEERENFISGREQSGAERGGGPDV